MSQHVGRRRIRPRGLAGVVHDRIADIAVGAVADGTPKPICLRPVEHADLPVLLLDLRDRRSASLDAEACEPPQRCALEPIRLGFLK